MKPLPLDIDMLMRMAHSPIRNYVIPGLTSWRIGGQSEDHGSIRMFVCDREHQEAVTPHSHRYEFQSIVLRESVLNRVWTQCEAENGEEGDPFQKSVIAYDGEPGKYIENPRGVANWAYRDYSIGPGQSFSMREDEIHSIFFKKNSVVLMFQGPELREFSEILQPCVDGVTIPSLEVKDWMYKK
jgi:hypothetical protein